MRAGAVDVVRRLAGRVKTATCGRAAWTLATMVVPSAVLLFHINKMAILRKRWHEKAESGSLPGAVLVEGRRECILLVASAPFR